MEGAGFAQGQRQPQRAPVSMREREEQYRENMEWAEYRRQQRQQAPVNALGVTPGMHVTELEAALRTGTQLQGASPTNPTSPQKQVT